MLFVFVYDILALSHKAKEILEEITKFYKAKDGSVRPPDIYLGSKLLKVQLGDGCEVWASPMDYVKNAIAVVEHLLHDDGEGHLLKNKAKNPFSSKYGPEWCDGSALWESCFTLYAIDQNPQVAVKLRFINIYEVSVLSQYQVNPCVGHLEAVYHIFS
jgi:hypothetical protein